MLSPPPEPMLAPTCAHLGGAWHLEAGQPGQEPRQRPGHRCPWSGLACPSASEPSPAGPARQEEIPCLLPLYEGHRLPTRPGANW